MSSVLVAGCGEGEGTAPPGTPGKLIQVEGLKVRTPQGWNTNIPLALQQAAFPKG